MEGKQVISITYIPPDWGFGNRLLYYNNLRQLAHKNNSKWSSVHWEGQQHFHGNMSGSEGNTSFHLQPCLGEKFFEWNSVSTRDIFSLNEKKNVPKNTAAVHFRGGDFFAWNKDAVLDKNYYLKAVEEIKNQVDHFIIFTDDESLDSYNEVEMYFEDNDISYDIGQNSSNRFEYIEDFSTMSSCDYIISSPSTYCVCAGFIGTKKKIIHSEDWIKNRVEAEDTFWVDLHNGGNDDYRIWKLI